MFPTLRALLLLIFVFGVGEASAMYQCREPSGKLAYQDTPCSASAVDLNKEPEAPTKQTPRIGTPAHRAAVADDLEKQLQAEQAKRATPKKPTYNSPDTAPNTHSSAQQMPFDQCVATVAATLRSLNTLRFIPVVMAPDVRVIRVCTQDESVLFTCSRADGTLVTTTSKGREYVGC